MRKPEPLPGLAPLSCVDAKCSIDDREWLNTQKHDSGVTKTKLTGMEKENWEHCRLLLKIKAE